MIKKNILLLLFIHFAFKNLTVCQIKGIGLPDIKNYKHKEYNGGTQNWAVDQDKKGNIYFANNAGLLQYDGSNWHKYNMPNHPSIRSLKIGNDEKIYVGGYNDFGYFETDSKGKLKFVSLSNLVNDNNRKEIDFIWKIHIFNNEVIFQSFERAYFYNGKSLRQLDAPNRFQFSFLVNNKLYFQDKTLGLLELKSNKLQILPNTTILNKTEVWGISQINDKKLLITTLNGGLYYYENNTLTQWNSPANTFTKTNSCLGGVTTPNGFILLNTVLDGLIVCDKAGNILQHINQKNGLQNNTLLTSFIDAKNNLWLGLDNGITFINISSPITYFGINYDVSTVYSSIVNNGFIYVATNRGLFYHSWQKPFSESPFKLIEGTTGQAWNIQLINNNLYCSHNKGLLLIKGNSVIKNLDPKGYFGLKPIAEKSTIWVGANYNGYSIFKSINNELAYSNDILGNNISSHNFELEDNVLWFLNDNILYQMKIGSDLLKFKSVKTFTKINEDNRVVRSIEKLNGKLYFQVANNLYTFSFETDQFTLDKNLSNLFKNLPIVTSIKQDSYENIWFVYNESLGMIKAIGNKKYTLLNAPFSTLKGNLVSEYLSVNTFDKNNIFIGLTNGLAHFDSELNNQSLKPTVYLRSFISPLDTFYFGNNSEKNASNIKVNYNDNNVKFTFASPTYESLDNIEFSYKLEDFDKEWSSWSTNTIKEYTNLREGNYTMNVKARNNIGAFSNAEALNFSVKPPIYRHPLAYILYLGLLISFIFWGNKTVEKRIKRNKEDESLEQQKVFLKREDKIKLEQIELEKEIEKLKNENLKIKLLSKDKELVNNSYQVVKKNKLLNGIIQKLKEIDVDTLDEPTKNQFNKLNKSITKEVKSDNSHKELEKHIKNVHFDFLKRLKEKHPNISSREMDLSTYLLLNMSTKEIAEIINISSAGVELARFRLRKKLNLNNKENLVGYLMKI
jgi:ligand-binding sensor domain-containing protein/DNA-binding CsgD family transcriptional regulator